MPSRSLPRAASATPRKPSGDIAPGSYGSSLHTGVRQVPARTMAHARGQSMLRAGQRSNDFNRLRCRRSAWRTCPAERPKSGRFGLLHLARSGHPLTGVGPLATHIHQSGRVAARSGYPLTDSSVSTVSMRSGGTCARIATNARDSRCRRGRGAPTPGTSKLLAGSPPSIKHVFVDGETTTFEMSGHAKRKRCRVSVPTSRPESSATTPSFHVDDAR